MRQAAETVLTLILFMLLALLQGNAFLSLFGISPNLLLIGFLLLAFVKEGKRGLVTVVLVAVGIVLVSLFWFPFWVEGFILLGLIAVGAYLLKPVMGGNTYLDFAITVGVGTVLFHLLLYLIFSHPITWSLTMGGAVYNIILGELVLLLVYGRRS